MNNRTEELTEGSHTAFATQPEPLALPEEEYQTPSSTQTPWARPPPPPKKEDSLQFISFNSPSDTACARYSHETEVILIKTYC